MSETTDGRDDGHDDGHVTLAEERARLRERWTEGTTCRCCTQRVQLYRRGLTSGMALALLSFYRATVAAADGDAGDGWLHAEETFKADRALPRSARGDFTKLRYWGLVEGAAGRRPDGSRRNGVWRLTAAGRAFCEGRLAVRKYVWLYNDREYPAPEGAAEAGRHVTVRDALGDRFDFDRMVSAGRGTSGRVAA